ncbi:YceK/YidQ family lipoprotein [Pseudomonas frederiksbergensis]|uniref:YceK/YidQ family lipoprotein n=1 Tax=Pseudomonas frederiksbergensis TaxID=104087 RepID=UPI003D20686E
MMQKMAVVLGVCSLTLSGCGTALTVRQDDADAARGLRKQKTCCQSIPRVLAYDFCVLNAPPDPTGILVPLVLLDLSLSGVLDTVVLPYTLYRQGADGNIAIYWRAGRG